MTVTNTIVWKIWLVVEITVHDRKSFLFIIWQPWKVLWFACILQMAYYILYIIIQSSLNGSRSMKSSLTSIRFPKKRLVASYQKYRKAFWEHILLRNSAVNRKCKNVLSVSNLSILKGVITKEQTVLVVRLTDNKKSLAFWWRLTDQSV